ncbi:MAG: YpdA family putative bacillithiol disulfide reductase [Candidatus Hydrogenedentota bacterium]
MKTYGVDEFLDLVSIGVGPSALAVLHAAKTAGLRAVGIDKGPVCGALMRHPTYMRWFSSSDKLELPGLPLITTENNPTRQEYLKYCSVYVKHHGLEINTYREVTAIERQDTGFTITARDMFGREYQWRARNVAAATGFYDSPRMLNVPGEELPKVTHRYTEAHPYVDQEVLVVGGGSSAAEAALELWRAGAHVTVAMRGERFNTKYWIEPDLENRIAEGSIAAYRHTAVEAIHPDEVELRDASGARFTVPNDFVLAMTGYEPDTTLVERAGAEVDASTGKPILTDDLESTVPGLYVCGTLTAGMDSNVAFVENSREHAEPIVNHILSKSQQL